MIVVFSILKDKTLTVSQYVVQTVLNSLLTEDLSCLFLLMLIFHIKVTYPHLLKLYYIYYRI